MRGIPFHLTLQEFIAFCENTGYLHRKGVDEGAASIGRRDHSKGYQADNIILQEFMENATHVVEEPMSEESYF